MTGPAKGHIKLSKEEFLQHWITTSENGVDKRTALLLATTPGFKALNIEDNSQKMNIGWWYLMELIGKQRLALLQLFIGITLGNVLQLIFPYLTQSLVNTGIQSSDISFIQIILAAQLMLLFSQTMVLFLIIKKLCTTSMV